ncbi:hypothetical protein BJX70DRAFT_395136 [Aspergillus crustosus]
MTPSNTTTSLPSMTYADFAKSSLALHHGPTVRNYVGTGSYEVSKDLICSHCPHFDKMSNGDFKESRQQSTGIESPSIAFARLADMLYVESQIADHLEARS